MYNVQMFATLYSDKINPSTTGASNLQFTQFFKSYLDNIMIVITFSVCISWVLQVFAISRALA